MHCTCQALSCQEKFSGRYEADLVLSYQERLTTAGLSGNLSKSAVIKS